MILYNLLSCIQTRRLTRRFGTPHGPKRLRFLLPNTAGKVVRHAREPLLRCTKKITKALGEPDASPVLLERPRVDGIGGGAISSAPNRKFKSVAILPLWLRRHTSLKNLKLHVGSIDSKPSLDSI